MVNVCAHLSVSVTMSMRVVANNVSPLSTVIRRCNVVGVSEWQSLTDLTNSFLDMVLEGLNGLNRNTLLRRFLMLSMHWLEVVEFRNVLWFVIM